jgi:RNA polymerase sigma-70 factor (ECF subfamily)
VRPEEIVEQFDEPIRRWFARRVIDRADAEDLAQDTIIAAIESFPRFRGDSSPRTWVYAIARNQFLKYIRGVRRRPIRLCDDSPEGAGDPGGYARDLNADRLADRITVQVIVAHLPLALREVYHLFYRDNLTTEAIARELHRSRGTVKYQLYEVRRRVRRDLRGG